MKIEQDVVMPDHPVCKKALKVAERIWKANGRPEGVTITSGKNGVHSAGSWHYFGAAFDVRTRFWDATKQAQVHRQLKDALPDYDVVFHSTHIHIEPNDDLARRWGLLL